MDLTLFLARLRKPYWLVICPDSGKTAAYGVDGDLIADQASDELLTFGLEHFAFLRLWGDLSTSGRPKLMASWMDAATVSRCLMLALRDVDTPAATVFATPDG